MNSYKLLAVGIGTVGAVILAIGLYFLFADSA